MKTKTVETAGMPPFYDLGFMFWLTFSLFWS